MATLIDPVSPRKPMIGLTPLIDVVFILLIFFMLVVQFKVYQQVPLATSQASRAPVQQSADTTLMTVIGNGQCRLQKEDIDCESAVSSLSEPLNGPVYLSYETETSLGDIIAVHEDIMAAGFEVSIALPSGEQSND